MNALVEYLRENDCQAEVFIPVQLSIVDDEVAEPLEEFLQDHTAGQVNELFGRDMFYGEAEPDDAADALDLVAHFAATVTELMPDDMLYLVELGLAERIYDADGSCEIDTGCRRLKWFVLRSLDGQAMPLIREWVDRIDASFREKAVAA